MARPRKDQEGPTAVERMEEAFWEILETSQQEQYSPFLLDVATNKIAS